MANELLRTLGGPNVQPSCEDLVENVRHAAVGLFGALRAAADEAGDRDVLHHLVRPEQEFALLEAWSSCRAPSVSLSGVAAAAEPRGVVAAVGPQLPRSQLRALTWNIASVPGHSGHSVQAPGSWSSDENLAAI